MVLETGLLFSRSVSEKQNKTPVTDLRLITHLNLSPLTLQAGGGEKKTQCQGALQDLSLPGKGLLTIFRETLIHFSVPSPSLSDSS